jgi:hypothetical protein
MKKWLITYGAISLLNTAALVVIYFWVGEPLDSFTRTNHPIFLAFFAYFSFFWFLSQGLWLMYFWKKFFSEATNKIVSYIFYLACSLLLVFAIYDILFFYLREGFRVAWYQVYVNQQQIDYFVHHAVNPIFMISFILLFFSITGFSISIRKKETLKYLIQWLVYSVIPIIFMVIWIGFIIYTDAFFELNQSFEPLYFARISIIAFSSILVFLLSCLAQKQQNHFIAYHNI